MIEQRLPDPVTLVGKRIEMTMRFHIPAPDGDATEEYWSPGTAMRAVKGKLKVGRKAYVHGWEEVEWEGEEPRKERVWWQHLRQSFYEQNKCGGWGVLEEGGQSHGAAADAEDEDDEDDGS